MRLANERGAARINSVTRVAIFLVVFGVVLFDLVAIAVNIFQLDELSSDAARAAATTWRETPDTALIADAVEDELGESEGVDIVKIAMDANQVWVTLRRPPPVIALDVVPALRDRIKVSVTEQATLDPQGI